MSSSCPSHRHVTQSASSARLQVSIALNCAIALAQLLAGLLVGSLSLLADALHNFSDVVSLVISYLAQKLAIRSYTTRQTFGFKRAEIFAALINAATLLAVAIMICRTAVYRLGQPVVISSGWVVLFAGLSIVVNAFCAFLLHRDAASSLNLRSSYLHLVSDMLTSVAVLLGGLAMYLYDWYWIDSLLSILIAIYLVYSSWGLLLETGRVLMQFSPPHVSLSKVERTIRQFEEIENIHHVHLWQLNDQEVHFEAHLDFKEDLPLSRVAEIIHKIRRELQTKHHISHTILQPEIGVDDAKELIASHC